MNSSEELKQIVKEKYSQIAEQAKEYNASSCCGSGSASQEVYNIMTDDYSTQKGYTPDADLGLGCGLPTNFAKIKAGDTVIDLGSGAGNDCFIARHETGESGKVLGIDFTDTMIKKARQNAEKLGFNNVEFRQGDIEDMPVSDGIADVVISNCVLNLVPDKAKVISEIFRVLKPGGHFSISDIVLVGELLGSLKDDATMYAGCVSGAIQKEEYLNLIEAQGFENMTLQKEKRIVLPNDILLRYMNEDEINNFNTQGAGIFSVTVFAQKPGQNNSMALEEIENQKPSLNACMPGSGCC
ncbi:MAG: arsenite methyltransferase [Cyclobacteriaceae bacterium]